MSFKPGDRVVCVKPRWKLDKGKVYTIARAYDYRDDAFVQLTELPIAGDPDAAFYAYRFELVSERSITDFED